MQVGGLSRVNQTANAPVEQVLVYNAALSAAEVAALAFGGPVDYADDPRLVYQAATDDLDTYAAYTDAGRDRYRTARPSLVGLLDTDLSAEWNPTGARMTLELPAPSGLGQGDAVQLDSGLIVRAMRVVNQGSTDLVYAG